MTAVLCASFVLGPGQFTLVCITHCCRNRAFCDAHGRYLHVPPEAGRRLEQQLALAMQERTRRSHRGRLLLVFDGSSSVDATPLRSPAKSLELGWGPHDDELEKMDDEAQQAQQQLPTTPPGAPARIAGALGAAAQRAGLGLRTAAAAELPWQAYCDNPQPTVQQLQRGPAQPASGRRPPVEAAPAEGGCTLGTGGTGGGEGGKGGWEEQDTFINLAPFMNRAPLAVRRFTPAYRVHRLFLSLSLRHLCVIDRSNAAVGIITRRDLVHAAHWGGG
jgi:CBS domain-containing protein